ncbi:hypothetical protein UlMin_023095 [Ulmus minor]
MTTNISECINVILLDPTNDAVYTIFDGNKNGIVDLDRRTCTCQCFQLEQLPCTHAMIAIFHRKRDVYELCSDYYSSGYWKATYAGVVYPLPHQGDWVIPNEVQENKLLPLYIRSVCSRRRKSRIPSVEETV